MLVCYFSVLTCFVLCLLEKDCIGIPLFSFFIIFRCFIKISNKYVVQTPSYVFLAKMSITSSFSKQTNKNIVHLIHSFIYIKKKSN